MKVDKYTRNARCFYTLFFHEEGLAFIFIYDIIWARGMFNGEDNVLFGVGSPCGFCWRDVVFGAKDSGCV
jgi:hypothetical protein